MRVKRGKNGEQERDSIAAKSEKQQTHDRMPTNSLCLPSRALFFQSLNLLLLLHTKSTNNNKHSDQEEENYCAAE